MLFESACLLAGPGRSTMFRTMEDVVGSIEWESLSEQTRKSYLTAWLRFNEFLPVDWKEATPEDVVAWVQTLAETVMTSTVETRIAGVSYFYRMFGNGNPCSSLKVKAALRVVRRRIGKGHEKKRALSSEEIMAIIQHYSITDPSDIRNAAIIAIGFSCALRRSEIVGLDLKDVNVLRSPAGLLFVEVNIRQSKTDQDSRGQKVVVPNGPRIRLVDRLSRWFLVRGKAEGPFFQTVKRGCRIAGNRIHNSDVARIVKEGAKSVGLDMDRVGAHSLRAGFVTEAARNGASVAKIMDVTRHRTPYMVTEYIRDENKLENHAGAAFL